MAGDLPATMHGLPAGAYRQHLIVLGKTRAGKSSVMRGMVEGLLGFNQPVCIIDPKGDWWGLKSSADGKRPGFPVIIFGGEHGDLPLSPRAGAEVGELIATGNRPCIIDLGGWTVKDRTRFFIDFASALFRLTRGARWLFIDEVHNFAPQGKVMDPDAGMMLHWANRLISEGSGKGLTVISASQRPQKVHKDFVTSNETLIAMRVIHPLDRKADEEWISGAPDKEKGREVLNSLATMKRGEGWVWSPEIDFGPVRIKFPMFSTYDSFKPQTGEPTEKLKGWASVDLDEVRGQLAIVEAEAKANDPKALRAELAALKKQMSGAVAAGLAGDQAAIAEAEERGFTRGISSIGEERDAGRAEGYAEGVRDTIEFAKLARRKQLEQVDADFDAFAASADWAARQAGPSLEVRVGDLTTITVPVSSLRTRPPAAIAPPRAKRPAPKPVLRQGESTGGELTGPLQKIIDAAAWWAAVGVDQVTKAQLAHMAGYAPGGGSFARYLSDLRSRGLLAGSGRLSLTDAGAAAAAPQSAGDHYNLRVAVLERLSGPLQAILTPLIEAYPEAVDRAALGKASGYEASGGSFARYLSSLSSLELIERGRDGIRTVGWLFP